jgi:tetratricopeptide (TPR) repeat protein
MRRKPPKAAAMLDPASLPRDDALDQAQDLIYDAWEIASAKRRIALARRALALSPLCADAYVVLAEHARRGSDEELDLWRRGVEAGKAAIGPAFAEYAGRFWGFLETRPYMRARCGLAWALWARGARDEAIDHLQEMLRLNPGDNQGVRFILAAWLVEADRDDQLAALFKAYPDEGGAFWTWTKAVAAFRSSGDSAKSRALLDRALLDNRHVPAYLLGAKRLPKSQPPYYSPGSEDEAILYAADHAAAWRRTSGALDWLRARAAPAKAGRRKPKRGARLH